MRLDAIHAMAFGALDDVALTGLGDAGVLVVVGPNEAGKSTLVDAVETALFGFDPPRLAAHPRAAGQPMRVRAAFLVHGRRLEVERTLGASAAGRVTVGAVTRDIGNAPLDHVAVVPRDLWRSLHRVSVDEAADAVGWHRAESRILGGGVASSRQAAPAVADRLEREARSLWRADRRGRPEARVLAEELERLHVSREAAVRRQQDAAREVEESRARARSARAALTRMRRALRGDVDGLTAAVSAAQRRHAERRFATAVLAEPGVGAADRLARRVVRIGELPQPRRRPSAVLWGAAALPGLLGHPLGWVAAALALTALAVWRAATSARDDRDLDEVLRRAGLIRARDPASFRDGWPALITASRAELRAARDLRDAKRRRRSRVASMREVLAGAREAVAAERARLRSAGRQADTERAPSPADVDGEIEAVTAALDTVRRERDRLMLTAAVLREADARLRSRVRPRLIAAASRHLAEITADDRELAVEESPSGPTLWLRTRGGADSIALARGSRGTREQALLALRLALMERAEEGIALPMILDDALSAWDPLRLDAAAALLARIGTGRQVVLLTPQPAVAAAFAQRAGALEVDLARSATTPAP